MQLHRASAASQTPASVPRSHGAHVCPPFGGHELHWGPVWRPCMSPLLWGQEMYWGPVRILCMSPDEFYWGLMWSARMRPFCGDTSCIGVRCLPKKNSRRLIPPCQLLLPSEPTQVTLVSDKREFWSCEKTADFARRAAAGMHMLQYYLWGPEGASGWSPVWVGCLFRRPRSQIVSFVNFWTVVLTRSLLFESSPWL